jgi:hypothetical protein
VTLLTVNKYLLIETLVSIPEDIARLLKIPVRVAFITQREMSVRTLIQVANTTGEGEIEYEIHLISLKIIVFVTTSYV